MKKSKSLTLQTGGSRFKHKKKTQLKTICNYKIRSILDVCSTERRVTALEEKMKKGKVEHSKREVQGEVFVSMHVNQTQKKHQHAIKHNM